MQDEIKVTYGWKPISMSHVGYQHAGAMCVDIIWNEEFGTVETWRVGEFDPVIYPVLEKSPFESWTRQ